MPRIKPYVFPGDKFPGDSPSGFIDLPGIRHRLLPKLFYITI